MSTVVKDLGPVTAYADAVAAGYTGTKEEWQALMASYASVAEEAQEAKEGAEAAQEAAESARDAAIDAKEGAKDAVDGFGAVVTQATNQAVQTVRAEGTTQVGNVSSEGTTQVNAVQAKGAEVLESIPADYTELSNNVSQLKEDLSELYDGYNLYNTMQLSGNNTAVTSNGDGSYTVGTADYGRSWFGGAVNVKAGSYLLYGVPQGSSYLNTTTEYGGALFVNESSIPKHIVIKSDTTLYLGFRIPSNPSASFVVRPFLYSTKMEKNAEDIEIGLRTLGGNLMETTLVSWTSGYINDSGGIGSSPLIEYSDYIDISGYEAIEKSMIYGGTEQGSCGAFYDANKVFISKLDSAHVILVPDNAKYMRLNRMSMYAERLRNGNYLFMRSASKWYGKTISALGDSITYGYGLTSRESEVWTTLIANRTGATVNNYGLNSSKVSNISGDAVQSFVDRRDSVPDSDLIIIFGGTNDYWHQQTAVGTATSYDVAMFGGALNYLFNYFQTQYPSKKILYIFPMHQHYSGNPDSHDFGYGSFNAFRQVAIGACANSGVPMLDLYATSGTNVAGNATQRSYYTQDGVHPNAVGQALLADLIYTYIENQLC